MTSVERYETFMTCPRQAFVSKASLYDAHLTKYDIRRNMLLSSIIRHNVSLFFDIALLLEFDQNIHRTKLSRRFPYTIPETPCPYIKNITYRLKRTNDLLFLHNSRHFYGLHTIRMILHHRNMCTSKYVCLKGNVYILSQYCLQGFR